MKKIFILMASAALVFAASCNKMEDVNGPVDTPVETETITVVLNPVTKTSLGKDGATTWSDNDAVDVIYNGNTVGTLTHVGNSEFTGELTTVGLTGAATLHYPAGVYEIPAEQAAVDGSFANRAALLEVETTIDDLRAGNGATLQNKTAILGFTSPAKGNVTFNIGDNKYTVTGCEKNQKYYVCVAPETGKLSYTVGVALGAKEKESFAPEASKFYELGELTLKENTTYGLVGTNNNWTDAMMFETSQDNFYVLFGVEFSTAGQFKIRKKGVWEDAYNFGSANTTTKNVNSAVGVFTHGSSADINVNAATYDVYFDRLAGQVYIMEPGKSHTEATKQPAPANTYYSLIGTIEGSSWNKDFDLKYSGDGIWTIVQNFAKDNEWKIRKNHAWTNSYNNVWVGWDLKTDSNGNVKMKEQGDYIVTYIEKNKNNETNIITLAKK